MFNFLPSPAFDVTGQYYLCFTRIWSERWWCGNLHRQGERIIAQSKNHKCAWCPWICMAVCSIRNLLQSSDYINGKNRLVIFSLINTFRPEKDVCVCQCQRKYSIYSEVNDLYRLDRKILDTCWLSLSACFSLILVNMFSWRVPLFSTEACLQKHQTRQCFSHRRVVSLAASPAEERHKSMFHRCKKMP